jgi:hypothetical protein
VALVHNATIGLGLERIFAIELHQDLLKVRQKFVLIKRKTRLED